jgi:hypothetical protein
MTAIEAQPNVFNNGPAVNSPISFLLLTTYIIANIIGTAITPFTTALQNNALIGLSPTQSIITHSSASFPRGCGRGCDARPLTQACRLSWMNSSTTSRPASSGLTKSDPRLPNARTGIPYQPGIGPHPETAVVLLVTKELVELSPERYGDRIALGVSYVSSSREKCDLCIGAAPSWEWAAEIKMLRLMGDNGKPNDNMLMHILSPYPAHRSAVTDCAKLGRSGLPGRKAILIYGFDYPGWPMDPAIEAFEMLGRASVALGGRAEAAFTGLIHPVHQCGRVFGWEVRTRAA